MALKIGEVSRLKPSIEFRNQAMVKLSAEYLITVALDPKKLNHPQKKVGKKFRS